MFRRKPILPILLIFIFLSAGVSAQVPKLPPKVPTLAPVGVVDKDGKGPARKFDPGKTTMVDKDRKPRDAGQLPGRPGDPVADKGPDKPGESPDAIKLDSPPNSVEVKPSGVSSVPCHPMDMSDEVHLDFKDIPLDDLIRLISCWTSKNLMLTQGFSGKTVTLMSPKPVTVAQAYMAFLSTLRAHGLVMVPAGAYMRIVPEAQGKTEPIPIIRKRKKVPDSDEFVTKILPLKHVLASEITQVLDRFKGKSGEIIAYGEDVLIITDTGTMIKRLQTLLKELDIPTDKEKIWIRQVEFADAGDLTSVITDLFQDSGGKKSSNKASSRRKKGRRKKGKVQATQAATVVGKGESIGVSKVISDERTNQLIVVCNRTTYLRIDKLLRKLDVAIPGEGQIHIVYLENADAEEISSTLSSLTSGKGGKRGKSSSSKGKKGSKGGRGSSGSGAAALFEGEVKITADEGTNALVIEASLKDFMSLKSVIDKLDIRRKQVYVEAIIMEISTNKNRKFGFSGSGGLTYEVEGETVPLLMGMGGLGITGFDAQQLMKGGMAFGLQGPAVDVSTGSTGGEELTSSLSIPTFGFLLQAIQSNSDVNILSTPHILTMDNEEAEIQVGKQIPYRASGMGGLGSLASMAGMAGLGGRSSSMMSGGYGGGYGGGMGMLGGMMGGMGMVQRIDVDLTLKITPHVNESNFVKLEIDQTIEDVESIDRELGPTTSKRKVKNVVVFSDQQPVVIGGLIRDTESDGVDKVPLLGDIPLIGVLFRKTVKTIEKKNLLMVIIPHIIDDPSDLTRIHSERMKELKKLTALMAEREHEAKGIVDYQKKVGPMESMRQVVDRAKAHEAALEKARIDSEPKDIIGAPETHDLDDSPEKQEKND